MYVSLNVSLYVYKVNVFIDGERHYSICKGLTDFFPFIHCLDVPIKMFAFYLTIIFFKLGFTPCKAEQPLQGMKLQEKEA